MLTFTFKFWSQFIQGLWLQLFNIKPPLLFMCRCRQSPLITSYAKKVRGQESAALVRHTEALGKRRRGQQANERGCRIQAEQQKRPEVCNRANIMFLSMVAHSNPALYVHASSPSNGKQNSVPAVPLPSIAACAMIALSCKVLHSPLCVHQHSSSLISTGTTWRIMWRSRLTQQ